MEERRGARRQAAAIPCQLARDPEEPLPRSITVDLSTTGILVCFPDEAVPLRAPDTVLISLQLPDGLLHQRAAVCRHVRGADGSFYLAAHFSEFGEEDRQRLDRFLAEVGHAPDAPDVEPHPS